MDSEKRAWITENLIEVRRLFCSALFEPGAMTEITARVRAISPDIAAAVGTDDPDIIAGKIQELMNSESARQQFFRNPCADISCGNLLTYACKI